MMLVKICKKDLPYNNTIIIPWIFDQFLDSHTNFVLKINFITVFVYFIGFVMFDCVETCSYFINNFYFYNKSLVLKLIYLLC